MPTQADEYINILQATAQEAPRFNELTNDTAGAVRDFIGNVARIGKEAEASRKSLKQPHLDAGRTIDESFKPVVVLVDQIVKPLKKQLSDFLAEQERIKREVAEKARKEAEAKAALAAKVKEDEFIGDFAEQEAEKAAKDAKYAELLAEQNNVKGTSDRAMGLRTYRKANVVNAAMLVGHYASNPDVIALCERLANAEIRAARGGEVSIPGIEIVEERKVA